MANADVFHGSASKFLTRAITQFYANKLQFHRHILGLFAAFNITCLIGKLYWHYATGRYDCTPLDFWSLVYAWTARFIWVFLFREPDRFFGILRPSWKYQSLVVGTVEMTTVPGVVLHVFALKRARVEARDVYAGVVNAVAALGFWVLLTGVVHWMAWVFLGREGGGVFEPVVGMGDAPIVAVNNTPYLDEPFDGAVGSTAGGGYLSAVYAKQRDGSGMGGVMATRQNSTGEEATRSTNEESNNEQNGQVSDRSRRCETVAKFNYMTQAHAGGHSWWSQPIIPVTLATCGTVILILLMILIHDDRKLPQKPSPTIKKSLYLPLGMYLTSFYALKHRTRASLFETFDTPVPEPWKRLFSILPTAPAFRNNLTGEVTLTDPRNRAMSVGKSGSSSCVDSNAYIKAYNSTPQPCTSYWGHLGRENTTNLRIRPATFRIGFLCLCIFLVVKGYWNTFFTYNPPNLGIIRLIPNLPHKDIERAERVVRIWQVLVFSGFVVLFVNFLYVGFMIVSVLVLWGHVILKYAERENREGEGRIRLE
ncbi:hypothetical protein BKA63DRAFT_596694 [Paraphoma chrysanthemicola]|nr:hypothetical protein BKA63DRAFT_596694 [Paraphoma chrysanthemicola]